MSQPTRDCVFSLGLITSCAGSADSAPAVPVPGAAVATSVAPSFDAPTATGVGAPAEVLDAGRTVAVAGAAASVPRAHVDAGQGMVDASQASTSHQTRVSLIDHERWQWTDVGSDPFIDRPSQVRCDPQGAGPEVLSGEDAFGVDTGACAYLTVRQLTQVPVAKGELLRVRAWHFALTAPAPAEGHIAVQLADTPVLDEHVPIPSASRLIKREVEAPKAYPAGSTVLLHVHNHGDNSWSLLELSVGP